MGFGLPSALGAAAAHDGKNGRPKRVVVDIDGDGSFLMNCQELATAAIEKLNCKVGWWAAVVRVAWKLMAPFLGASFCAFLWHGVLAMWLHKPCCAQDCHSRGYGAFEKGMCLFP
jgi:hypothetical protein